jgi:mannose-6-phosphate isomerase-like protein (cupin superfamily)
VEGVDVREVAGPESGTAVNQSLVRAVLAPGARTIEHLHRRSEEVVWVLEGSAVVRIDGVPQAAAPGSCVVIAPGARHQLTNTGDGELIVLACCAPPYSPQDTVTTA